MRFSPIFAQSTFDPAVPLQPRGSSTGRLPAWFEDVFLIIGLAFLLFLLLVLWAKYVRKRSRSRSDSSPAGRVLDEAPKGGSEQGSQERHSREHQSTGHHSDGHHSHGHHHRRKRRRKRHRSRNPTLAETGGLPEPKTQEDIPPSI